MRRSHGLLSYMRLAHTDMYPQGLSLRVQFTWRLVQSFGRLTFSPLQPHPIAPEAYSSAYTPIT
jgi:hypothetical protein